MTIVETIKEEKLSVSLIALSIILLVLSILVETLWFLALIPVIICGFPILKEVVGDARNKEISAEALVTAALISCVLLGEYVAAAEVAIIMAIGELLETIVTTGAKSGMDELGKLKVDKVRLLQNGDVIVTNIESVQIGSRIRILPGEVIPLDGIIIQGNSSVNKSIITGESMPVDVSIGDLVYAGTFNMYGSMDVEVTKSDSDSTIARMADLLKKADASKSKIVGTADRWAKYILLGAAIFTIGTFVVTQDVYRALTIMVVFCPCAFVLATPSGIMAAAGNMARNGILLRDTTAIEGMAKVNTVLFDKTGTLTTGSIVSKGFTDISGKVDPEYVEHLVSALETRSEHPLGMAIASSHEPKGEVEDFLNIPGQGVVGTVDGHRVAAGNHKLMASQCQTGLDRVVDSIKDIDCTAVLIGIDGETVGFIGLEDKVKEESVKAIRELRSEGVRTIMLTGDNGTVGRSVAGRLHMDDVVWECLPETKLKTVSALEGSCATCMLGDGMNDAPSLKRATVGISMGSIGNDLAVESSDIIFMNDDIGKVPGLLRLCRNSVRTIYAGLALSMTINIIGTILAMLGIIDPILGAIIHNGGSIIVILLASSLLWSDPWSYRSEKRYYPSAQ